MRKTLSSTCFIFYVATAMSLLFSITASSQAWTFRNGFGQNDGGGGFPDIGRAACTDAAGNIYIAGQISDALIPNTVSFGGTPLISAGDDDGFVAKFNSAGVHQWSLRFGGTALEFGGYGIVTDGTSVYVVGEANGTITVGTSGTTYPTVGGGLDGFVMKLDAGTGALSWLTRFGGGNSDRAQAVCLDPSGNVYISGYFRTRTANPTATFGSFTRTVQGNTTAYTTDLFAAALNSSGTFLWVSTGGSAGGNDNINGSGICYVPSLAEVVVVGNYRSLTGTPGSTTATYSTTTPASSVILTNSNSTTNEDFCLLEVAAATGAFVSGSGVGAGDGNEGALGITYDTYTTDVFFAGYFSSASTTFPGNPSNTNASATHDNIMYGRYNPSTDAYTWVKDVDNSSPAAAADVARAITTDGLGGVLITGNFRNTATFPGGSTVVGSGVQADIFLARINVATGNAVVLTQGTGTSPTADDIGNGIAFATGASGSNNIWITGQYASSVTFSPLAALASAGGTEDVVLAKYNNPAPNITGQPSASTACSGVNVSFTVTATGPSLTYQWQESANVGFTAPTNLTNTGVYSNVTTATLNISDNSALDGKYYRVVITNPGGIVNSNGALLTVTAPTLPSSNTLVVHVVNTNNNYWYNASCALVGRVVPSGGSPISGNTAFEMWRESSVLTYGGQPYVQRHYQVTPTAGSTGTVTMYYTQVEFDNFNAHAGSLLNLPTGPGDATGIANMRYSKFNGTTNNGTGLPGSYTGGALVMNPVDANVIWNATFSRWEVTMDVSGFSGFFLQTSLFVLPVNLTSFAAQKESNDIRLKWQTADETSNDHFEVERSLDGRTFTNVGQRTGNNGAGIKNYELLDAGAASLGSSKIFYRLKIVSFSGSIEYSNTVVVYLDKQTVMITGVNPNPFIDKLNVNLNMPKSGQLTMKLIDMTGRVLLNEFVQAPKGFSTYTMKGVEKVTPGMYILSAEFDGQVYTYKVKK